MTATAYYLKVDISFTVGSPNGSTLTNHEYALSTNGGVSYGSWTAFSPEKLAGPVEITGLVNNTLYYVKLRAVSDVGIGSESTAISFTTNQNQKLII